MSDQLPQTQDAVYVYESGNPQVTTCGDYGESGLESGTLNFTPKPTVYSEAPATAKDIKAAYPEVAAVNGFAEKIVQVANELGIADPGWLANVMYFESGLTFDPSKINKLRCVGLIQFCPGPKSGQAAVGKTGEELAAMGAVEQMDYVKLYLAQYYPRKVRGRSNTSADLYMAIYYPAAVGRGPDYSIFNDYFRRKGASGAAKYLEDNGGIKTASDYQMQCDRFTRMPTAFRNPDEVASL